ncbi:hypothetical protein O4220_27600 [Rhodococcus ruber]|uniref:Tyr recombinase domain-containing protein n=1 Tax=Rhodococcus ruber TaxID=1830 RepID=A0ABT4MNQ5_9NOCA|nr:hypothetical protein [Rhodococcus ruber]MCZ4522304.1 hypothetical protein [Rhodococcus ruber]
MTAASFGRRDAVLLLLAGAGLSYNAITGLDRDGISADGASLWIGGRHRIHIDPDEATGLKPVEVWQRWHTVLMFSDRYPSTTLLAEHLQRNTFPDMTAFSRRGGPVANPIDRCGHPPLPAAPMTSAEIGSVIAAHRTGLSPRHTSRRVKSSSATVEQIQTAVAECAPVTPKFDSGYYPRWGRRPSARTHRPGGRAGHGR